MHGKRVGLMAQRQRYRCPRCEHTFLDRVLGMDEHHRVTARLKMYVAEKVLSRPFTHWLRKSGSMRRPCVYSLGKPWGIGMLNGAL